MTCNKKGPCKEEKAKNVEKLTDEEMNKITGGKAICRVMNLGGSENTPDAPNGTVGGHKKCSPHCQPKWLR